jgi:hypothetical protein
MFMHRINLFTARLDNSPQTNADQVLERVSTLHTCSEAQLGRRKTSIKAIYFADSRLVTEKFSTDQQNQNRRNR